MTTTTTITATTAAESRAAIANLKVGDVLSFDGHPAQLKIAKIHQNSDGKVIAMTAGNEMLTTRATLPGFILDAYKMRAKAFSRFHLTTAA